MSLRIELSRINIIVIKDQNNSMSFGLEDQGLSLTEFDHIPTNIEQLSQAEFTIIITADTSICRDLLSQAITCPVYIILETLSYEAIESVFAAGASDYLSAPLQIAEFKARILQHFRHLPDVAETALQLSRILEHSPTAIAMFDKDMRYLHANAEWKASYRLDESIELIGRSHYDVFPEIGDDWKAIHQRCLAGDVDQVDVAPFPRENGKIDWLSWEVLPWYKDDDTVGGLLMYTKIITAEVEAKQAFEAAEAGYTEIIENATDAVLIIQNEHIIYANQSTYRILGYPVDELIGHSLWAFIAPDYLDKMRNELQQFKVNSSLTKRYEIQVIPYENNLIDVEISISEAHYGGSPSIAIFMRDISERKLAELVVAETQQRLHAQAHSLITINQIADSLHQALDVNELAKIAVDVCQHYLGADFSVFYVTNMDQKHFELVVAKGASETLLNAGKIIPFEGTLNGELIKQKKIIISEDLSTDDRIYSQTKSQLTEDKLTQIICIPALLDQEVLGALNLGFKSPKNIDIDTYTTLQAIGQTLGLALSNARSVGLLVQEIHERQAVEAALRLSDQRLQSVITAVPVILFAVDPDAVFTLSRGRGLALIGLEKGEAIGQSAYKLFPDDKALHEVIQDALAGNEGHQQVSIHNKIFDVYYSPLANNSGASGVCIDVSERMRAQDLQNILFKISRATSEADSLYSLLSVVQKELSQLLDTTNFYVALHDSETGLYSFPYWQDAHETDHALWQPHSLEKTLTDHVRKTGQSLIIDVDMHNQLYDEGIIDYQDEVSQVWLGVPLKTSNRIIGVIAIQSYDDPRAYDLNDLELMSYVGENIAWVIESKQSEEALRISEERFSKAFYSSPDSVTISSRSTGLIIDVNEGFERIFGYTRDEAIGKTTDELRLNANPDGRQDILTPLIEGGSVRHMEMKGRRKSGEIRDCQLSAEPITIRGEECIVTIVHDITERKQAELALQKSEETAREAQKLLELVLNTIPTRVFWKNRDLVFEGCNQVLADDLGFSSPKEIIGKTDFDINPNKNDAENYRADDKAVMAQGIAKIQYEEAQTRPDGSIRWLETSKIPMRNADGEIVGVLGTYIDITDRKEAALALEKSEETARDFQTKLQQLHEISFELSNIDSLVDIYRRAVELGREKLGYDRMALFLVDTEEDLIFGTFGTDEKGQTRNEQDIRRALSSDPQIVRITSEGWNTHIAQDTELRDYWNKVGWGWNGLASLWDGSQVIGILAVDNLLNNQAPRPFERDLLSMFGAVLGYVISGKQSDAARQNMVEQLQLLNDIDQAILAAISPRGIAGAVIHQLKQLVDADYVSIISLNDEKREYDILAWTSEDEIPGVTPFSFAGDIFDNERLRSGIRYDVPDLGAITPLSAAEQRLYKKGVRSHSILPLMTDRELVGVLTVGLMEPGGFSQDKLAIIRGIATQLALAFRQAMLLEKVQAYATDLEQLVEERTAQLTAKANELEAFTYSVSHDLRAPLRAISGFADVVIEDFEDQLEEEASYYLERIRYNAHRMDKLIDDLLRLSRVGRRDLETRTVKPASIVRAIIEELGADEQIGTASITIDDLPECEADPTLLKQLWFNLITNAIKYSQMRENPQIIISSEKQNDEIVYFIRDNGVGFDMQFADKLFGVFQRLHQSPEYQGTGIGLATVYRIVERHQGRVWAEAKPDKGATFFFTIGF